MVSDDAQRVEDLRVFAWHRFADFIGLLVNEFVGSRQQQVFACHVLAGFMQRSIFSQMRECS